MGKINQFPIPVVCEDQPFSLTRALFVSHHFRIAQKPEAGGAASLRIAPAV